MTLCGKLNNNSLCSSNPQHFCYVFLNCMPCRNCRSNICIFHWNFRCSVSSEPTDHHLPPTDHLPTTYQPLTNHLRYRLSTDHLPTIYRPPTNHFFYGAACSQLPANYFAYSIKKMHQIRKMLCEWHLRKPCLDNFCFLQDVKLVFVQKLVRACNPQAAFILARGGEVTRSVIFLFHILI